MRWLAQILILLVFFMNKELHNQYLCYFVSFLKTFTPKFKSTCQAILYTTLIDRLAVYSTRASGL